MDHRAATSPIADNLGKFDTALWKQSNRSDSSSCSRIAETIRYGEQGTSYSGRHAA